MIFALVARGQTTVPRFTMMSYSASVVENASIGTIVLSVVAQPATSIPPLCSNMSSITYSTIPSMLALFSIESDGAVVIRGHLDYETQQFHMFQVVAQDGCSEAMAEVNITVVNVDDSAPLCSTHLIYLSISESTPPSNTTFYLHCTDPDNSGATIIYSVAMGNDDGAFSISGSYLSTLRQLNYESNTQYLLVIHVTKTTYPSNVTEVIVFVTVLPTNEFSPVFSSSIQLSYNISESMTIGSSIASITAQDDDDGCDGIITYSLSTAQDCFTIDPSSGDLVLFCILDREMQDIYYITVVAKDNPVNGSLQRSNNITVELNVLDVNDNAPQFVKGIYTLSVLETVTNTVLLSLHCSDTDEGVNADIIYHILDDGNSLNHFYVDSRSGNLSVGNSLDYESQQFHQLKVQCSDNGEQQLSSTATVAIQVLSVDEYDPVIQLEHNGLYYVAEDSPVGIVITTVSATDLDTGPAGEVVFSINRSSDDINLHCPEGLFEIDSTSGSLYLLSMLDKEIELPFTPPVDYTYQCPLVVSNQHPDSRRATDVLRLSIGNVNDVTPACDQTLIIIEIFENFAIGNDVCSFACHDDDSPILTYSMADPLLPFGIVHNTTHVLVRLVGQLDYEAQTQYNFEVIISDTGIPPLSTAVMVYINVKNVNEHVPEFIVSSDSVSIAEDSRVGTIVCRFSASDNDSESDLYYTIVKGSDLVALDGVTGVLYLAASLDRETINDFYLTVQVGDADPVNPLTDVVHLNVTVSDVNDNAPIFTSPVYYVSLAETTLVGSSFHLPICTDNDDGINSLLSYQITLACLYPYDGSCTSITIESSPFSFNFSSREGIVTSMLDYEVTILYVFEVVCRDHGTPELSASAVMYVEVIPVNEFMPSFDSPSYNVTITEDVAVASSFLTVTASDSDSGVDGELSYNLSSSLGHFAIDHNTGMLFITQHLDREQQASYTLEVTASDNSPSGSRSTQVNIYITVGDVNDNHPLCEQETIIIRISELTSIGSSVIQLNCSDIDQLNTLHYAIHTGNEQGQFTIHDNGTITLSSLLDLPEYHLVVSVSDSFVSPLSVIVNCFVYVDKATNQHPPTFVFDTLEVNVTENEALGHHILQVTGADLDQDSGHLRYYLNESFGAFHLDAISGVLYLIQSLDYESQTSYNLSVTVADESQYFSAGSIIVHVVDVNDNGPLCDPSFITKVISDEVKVGQPVATLNCYDQDSGINSQLQFLLMQSNSDMFAVNKSTGEIFVTHDLSTSTSSCFLTILVSDKGTPVLTHIVIVEISIQKFPNDTAVEPPNEVITMEDEGKNNSLTVTFTHLTLELVSCIITWCALFTYLYFFPHSGMLVQKRNF